MHTVVNFEKLATKKIRTLKYKKLRMEGMTRHIPSSPKIPYIPGFLMSTERVRANS